ncbi:MAG: DUF1292 domain-containing protein [Lachnospiraceae bacterium]|nr:DUF1292 domain-containing protein [Lachnospiraceae bacterium]
MGKQFEEVEEPDMTVTVYMDDGSEVECAILTIFEVEGQDYIALLPVAEDSDEVFLYRYTENEAGEPGLDNIASDDEYEKVADAFDEWLDEQEYDELVDAEEDEE